MTDMRAEHGIDALARPVVYLIVGPARSGKDTAALELHRLSKLPAQSTSEAFFKYRGITRAEFAMAVGDQWRTVLASWMASYNYSDGSACKLYRRMFADGVRIFNGIRRLGELEAFVAWLDGRADVRVWWIDASKRKLPDDPTMEFGAMDISFTDGVLYRFVDSNGSVDDLRREVRKEWEAGY